MDNLILFLTIMFGLVFFALGWFLAKCEIHDEKLLILMQPPKPKYLVGTNVRYCNRIYQIRYREYQAKSHNWIYHIGYTDYNKQESFITEVFENELESENETGTTERIIRPEV